MLIVREQDGERGQQTKMKQVPKWGFTSGSLQVHAQHGLVALPSQAVTHSNAGIVSGIEVVHAGTLPHTHASNSICHGLPVFTLTAFAMSPCPSAVPEGATCRVTLIPTCSFLLSAR